MTTSASDGIEVMVAPEELAAAQAALDAEPSERVRLMRDAAVNASGILVPSAVALLLVPIMLRGLGDALYGFWIAVAALVAIFSSFDLGLGWTVVRQIACDTDGKPAPATVAFFQAAATAYLLMGIGGGVALWIAGAFVQADLEVSGPLHPIASFVFAMMAIGLVGDRMTAFTIAVLHGMRRFGSAVLLMSSLALVRGAGIALLLWSGAGIRGVAAWHMMAALVSGLSGLVVISAVQPGLRMSARTPVWRTLRRHLEFGLASQFTSVATSVTWQAGALVVGAFASASAIVPLHVGQRFPLFASGIGWRAAEVAFPAAGQRRQGDAAAGAEILSATTRWALAAVLPMCIVLGILAPNILRVWLGEVDGSAVAVLRLTAAAVVADVLGVGAIHLLWGSGRARTVLAIVGSVAAATALLTVALVPKLGVTGAALALGVSLLGGASAALLVAARSCRASAGAVVMRGFSSTAVPAGLCGVTTIALAGLVVPSNWWELALVVTTTGAVYLLSMLRFGLYAEERTAVMAAWRKAVIAGKRDGKADAATLEPQSRQFFLRRWLKRIGPLRSLWHLYLDTSETLRDTPDRAKQKFDQLHRERHDPWDYTAIPTRGEERFNRTSELLDSISRGGRFHRALEVGCSEGLYTRWLALRCEALLAVDISTTALERARARCEDFQHVAFRAWDLRREDIEGRFDLIVAMGVLESFGRPRDLATAREKLVTLLRPGGWLLVETTRVNPAMEDQWWRRRLHRGRWLNAFIAEHPRLLTVSTAVEAAAIRSLFQKR